MGNVHNSLEVITTYRHQISKAVRSKHEVGKSIIRSRALFSLPVVTRKNTSILQAFTKPEHNFTRHWSQRNWKSHERPSKSDAGGITAAKKLHAADWLRGRMHARALQVGTWKRTKNKPTEKMSARGPIVVRSMTTSSCDSQGMQQGVCCDDTRAYGRQREIARRTFVCFNTACKKY